MHMCEIINIIIFNILYDPPVKGWGLQYIHHCYHKLVVKADYWIRLRSVFGLLDPYDDDVSNLCLTLI